MAGAGRQDFFKIILVFFFATSPTAAKAMVRERLGA
jgi:hypothetical protein